MCVTFFKSFSSDSSSNLSFILLFNREEVRSRANTVAENKNGIICGTDLQTGTTWLAINTKLRKIAFLTNFRSPQNNERRKWKMRGELIKRWVEIESDEEDTQFTQELVKSMSKQIYAIDSDFLTFSNRLIQRLQLLLWVLG